MGGVLVVIDVQVGATDTGGTHREQHLSRIRSRLGQFPQRDVAFASRRLHDRRHGCHAGASFLTPRSVADSASRRRLLPLLPESAACITLCGERGGIALRQWVKRRDGECWPSVSCAPRARSRDRSVHEDRGRDTAILGPQDEVAMLVPKHASGRHGRAAGCRTPAESAVAPECLPPARRRADRTASVRARRETGLTADAEIRAPV